MLKQIYDEQDLPMEALEKIGLAKEGVLHLDEDDLKMLLAGRRTDMLRLEDLEFDGMHIDLLDAKLSLSRNDEGQLELKFHPIRSVAVKPPDLSDAEAEKLEKGEVVNIAKTVRDKDGKVKDLLIEFDKETNEFIVTDSSRILEPDRVNGEYLTPDQKEKYRKGKEVEMPDGTKFQYSATEKQGIRSNRLALIASIIIDGGLSFALYHGLHALFGEIQDKEKAAQYSKGYGKDLEEMQQQQQGKEEHTEEEISR